MIWLLLTLLDSSLLRTTAAAHVNTVPDGLYLLKYHHY